MSRFSFVCSAAAAHLLVVACGGGSPTTPSASASPSAPAASSLTWHLAASSTHAEASGQYTTANASFGGNVRTTCVPNPNIAGSVCPDLMVRVVASGGRGVCQLWAFAPQGETLRVQRTYQAQRGNRAGFAGLDFNCSGGPECNWSVGQFTIHELASDAAGIVTRLHMTLEQTCSDIFTLSTAGFGLATGELWIVNGTQPFL